MAIRKIRVMIIDDSIFFREFMSRALATAHEIEIVGTFGDPEEAMTQIAPLFPDVICVDMEMPKMRGAEFCRAVLPRYPRVKAIVISAISNNVFEALQAGALDFVSKPNTRPGFDNNAFLREVLSKIKMAASAAASARPASAGAVQQSAATQQVARPSMPLGTMHTTPKNIVAIGASTGGTEAIVAVVKDLPANTPGIVIVQHMPPVFTRMYAERLDKICKMRVREAQNGDRVEPGLILIAEGGDKQMRVKNDSRGYYVQCEVGEKVSGHCPSVDVLFESVAKVAGPHAVGVILTGMGADGAKNLLEMKKAGAYTIGQDQATCVVYGMPMVAYNLGGVTTQMPLNNIGEGIVRHFMKQR